jgi:hypothetical protein
VLHELAGILLHDEILETNHNENCIKTSDKFTEKISQTLSPTVMVEASLIAFRFFVYRFAVVQNMLFFFKVPVDSP